MDFFTLIAEDKIKRAYKDGEFEQLSGMGKPLKLDDLSHVPESLRMGYKLLKNAGMMEEDVQIKKEIMGIEDLLKNCYDEIERVKLQEKLSAKQLQLEQFIQKRKAFHSPASAFYKEKVYKKLT
ncbi:DnaJ family domain-containing protein [Bacillus sp. FJAT-47783]|uniref:DnaJ family domain-containing protein n=1 Tax=Bacillus sp. FJAT-47783 TaxID=2922712 RepID=UPI001FACFB6F|nr:DnaJ family domain-containing protein [Bacillus sp. FJAT-47783]